MNAMLLIRALCNKRYIMAFGGKSLTHFHYVYAVCCIRWDNAGRKINYFHFKGKIAMLSIKDAIC